MRVLKFGGSSVESPERVRRVAAIVEEALRGERALVVVSAVAGVTDRLAAAVLHVREGGADVGALVEELEREHLDLLRAVCTGRRRARGVRAVGAACTEIHAALRAIPSSEPPSPPQRDRVVGAGELLSTAIVAAALQERGEIALPFDAISLIRTEASPGDARWCAEETRRRVRDWWKRLPECVVPVVTGFRAADASGRLTTLGRGGSDYSAAILGASLAATRVEIWTDVAGIFSGDPDRLPGVRALVAVSPRFAAELSWAGARVLHPRTLEPLVEVGVPAVVRSSLEPARPGTALVDDEPGGTVRPFAVAVRAPVLLAESETEIGAEALTTWTSRLVGLGLETLALIRPRPGRVAAILPPVESWPERLGSEIEAAGLGDAIRLTSGLSLVSAVGHETAHRLVLALGAAMEATGVIPLGVYSAGGERATAIVPEEDADQVARALHDELSISRGLLGREGTRHRNRRLA